MPPLRGEGATCLVFRCTHSPYENEMRPQLDSRPRLLTTRTNSGTERPEIDGKGSPLPPSRLPTRVRSSISGQDCGPAEKQKSSVCCDT
ncbi:UNVERIFIED_CONTAM: hypothetical protein Slati_4518500 [Sesamum latifolium]|uniref:Uncharacterized protein n=1 Tax=Sesamum latifolium TaxID=2727402 RepID=A0AAW2SI58_9LAMI